MPATQRALSPAAPPSAAPGAVIGRVVHSLAEEPGADHVSDPVPAHPELLVARDLARESPGDVVVERVVRVALGVLACQEVRPRGAIPDYGLDDLLVEPAAPVDDALVQPESERVGRQGLVRDDDGVVPASESRAARPSSQSINTGTRASRCALSVQECGRDGVADPPRSKPLKRLSF